VHDLTPGSHGIEHHPYLTFGYVSFGTERDPDFEWPRTEKKLLEQAGEEMRQLTDSELTELYGSDMVN